LNSNKNGKPVPEDNVQVEVKLIEKAPDVSGGKLIKLLTFFLAIGDIPAEVKDNGDGTYSARYDPKVPGKSRVNVTILV